VVKWAIDVPTNKLAIHGFKMTEAGYLKGVSVGFQPVKAVSRYASGRDFDIFSENVRGMGLDADNPPERIYLEQEQVELSAVCLPANPNALSRIAKAYHAGVLDDEAIDDIGNVMANIEFTQQVKVQSALAAEARAAAARAKKRNLFLDAFERKLNQLKKG